jgi:hypothetical protein
VGEGRRRVPLAGRGVAAADDGPAVIEAPPRLELACCPVKFDELCLFFSFLLLYLFIVRSIS